MFVPREIWVTANYKESQLQLMRPGQPVELRIDAFPDRSFRGHVDSIQAGSGTRLQSPPRRERDRQLRESGAARAGEDRVRRVPPMSSSAQACRWCRP